MAMRCAVSFAAWLTIQLLTWRLTSARASVSTASAGSTAPLIRIAYIHDESQPFTIMQHMALHLGPAGNRTFLPDYEITIDSFPIEGNKDMTPTVVVNIMDEKTPTYHAIAGPHARGETLAMVNVVAAARILNIHKGNSPALSNRELYPYTFRAIRPLQGIISIWYHISSYNGWTITASVWAEEDTFQVSTELASQLNITDYPSKVVTGETVRAMEAWQEGLVDLIRSTRLRVIMVSFENIVAFELACRLHEEKLSGLQFFAPWSWVNSWWLGFAGIPLPSGGQCSADAVYSIISGYLLTTHTLIANGVNLPKHRLSIPAFGGDFSQVPLSCMPHMTPQTWFNDEEHVAMAWDSGFVTDFPGEVAYIGNGASEQDQVCAALLGIHDVLYNKGISLRSIERREEAAFQELVRSTEDIEFMGPGGRFKFVEDTGDPEYIWHALAQYALPDLDNMTGLLTAIVTWPNGASGKPHVQELHAFSPLVPPLRWHDGSTGIGKNEAGLYPDCAILNAELKWETCEPCPAGTFYDKELKRCRPCPPGKYQNKSGSDACIVVSPGFFVTDPTQDTPCPLGHECPRAGLSSPQPCTSGKFADMVGQSECKLCDFGEYQENEVAVDCSNCTVVLEGSTTASLASKSPDQCLCPRGRYRPLRREHHQEGCLACPEGMECPEGSDMQNFEVHQLHGYIPQNITLSPHPEAIRGYMTLWSAPLRVYLCRQEGHCPGGHPGSCSQHRDGTTVACGDCENDAYETGGDECIPCEGASGTRLFAAVALAMVLVVIASVAVNRDVHKAPAATIIIIAVSGLLFTSVLALGVFDKLSIPWTEPVKSMLKLANVLSFDMRVLKLSCVVGVNAVRSFALRQTIALIAIPCVGFTILAKKYVPRFGVPDTNVGVEMLNAVGTIYSLLFIAIVISAIHPFVCYEHPGNSGESVVSAPSLLCFDGGTNHTAMVFIGILAFSAIPLPFLALCMYAIVAYPSRVTSHSSQSFLHAFRFLFFRFTPKRYYFQVIILFRSLLLCLVPAVLRGQPSTQVLFMCFLLGWYILLVETLWPWRSLSCTALDALMSMFLLMMLICGALLIPDVPQSGAVSAFSAILLASLLGSGSLYVLYSLARRLAPKHRYSFFICHHKAHAAAQARYLKILLKRRRLNAHIFIDSDNLQALDTLFDTVKSRVRHLIVLLTAGTLRRPWCAGEVATAFKAGLPMTRLLARSFVAPTQQLLANLAEYLDSSSGCNLSEYGIDAEQVVAGFAFLLGPSVIELELDVYIRGTRRFECVAAALLGESRDGAKITQEEKTPSLADVRSGSVIFTTDSSDEGVASGGIILARIAEEVFRACDSMPVMLANFKPEFQQAQRLARTAPVGVVILTAGCLECSDMVAMVCQLMEMQGSSAAPTIISMHTPSFEFPTSADVESFCGSLPGLLAIYDDNVAPAVDHLKSFFKNISIHLPTHSSQQALDTQADEVLQRLAEHFSNKKFNPSRTVTLHDLRKKQGGSSNLGSRSDIQTKSDSQSLQSLDDTIVFDPDELALTDDEEELPKGVSPDGALRINAIHLALTLPVAAKIAEDDDNDADEEMSHVSIGGMGSGILQNW